MVLLGELRRRNVHKILAAYVVAAWGLIEVAGSAFPGLGIPEAAIRYVYIAAILGFPIAFAFSWRFDISTEGLQRTPREANAPSTPLNGSDYLALATLCVLTLGDIGWLGSTLYSEVQRLPDIRSSIEPTGDLDTMGLAVIPFEYAGAASDDKAFLATGIYDNLMTAIGKVQALRIVSRQTMRRYADSTIPEIATELGVMNVLAGSVSTMGNQVTINVQLVNAANDRNVWAETYHRSDDPIPLYEFQRQVVYAVARELQAIITSDESNCIDIVPTENREAYRLYSLGIQKLDLRSTDSVPDAAKYFERAIEADPGYAEAYVLLAQAYRDIRELTGEWIAEDTEQRTHLLIDRALELNPCLGEAIAARASWFPNEDNAWAESQLERALQLSPNSAFIYELYGDFLHISGIERWQESLEMYEEALRRHPVSARLYVSASLMLELLNRFEKAETYLRKAIEIDPRFTEAYNRYGMLIWSTTNRLDEAMVWLRKGYALDPSNIRAIAYTGWIYLYLDDIDEAERWFREADRQGPNSDLVKVGLSDIYHARGQHDLELEPLKKQRDELGWEERRGVVDLLLIDHLVQDGRYGEAASVDRDAGRVLPGLDDPIQYRFMDVLRLKAQILAGTGETERAENLYHRLEDYIENNPPDPFFMISAAQVFAAQHKKERALDLLRKANDAGFPPSFRELELPIFDILRDVPWFQDLIKETESNLSQQLANVREKERSGEIILLQSSD